MHACTARGHTRLTLDSDAHGPRGGPRILAARGIAAAVHRATMLRFDSFGNEARVGGVLIVRDYNASLRSQPRNDDGTAGSRYA